MTDGPLESAMSEVVFHSVLPVTMLDFPGKLAYTVCTAGCNFRCPICHNRELALSLTEGMPEISVSSVIEEIENRDGWIDGVCITGGEPLLQPGLREAIERFRAAGLAVKLDTNGALPQRLGELLDDKVLDYVAMDIKAPLAAEEYSVASGVEMKDWLGYLEESVERIKLSGIEYEFRTVCVPGMHTPESISRIAERLKPCDRYTLGAFRPMNTLDPEYERKPGPTLTEMDGYLGAARRHLPATTIGNA